jgi:AcrR family transcriptional regulator
MTMRKYDSPARDAAKQETRDHILDALVEVVTREGVHAFTVQKVADAAGVTHRTVYRHFATREDLLDGLDELIERRGREAALDPEPAELTDLPELVSTAYRSFDAFPDAIRAYVIVSIALGRKVASFERRSRMMREYIARIFPGLTEEEVAEAAGVIRLLGSSRGWHLLTTEQDLSTDAAARAASRAVEVLLADLAARSRRRSP